MKTNKYKISGMDCEACATLLELDMEEAGLTGKCSYPKEELEINLKNSDDKKRFQEVVSKSGYKISQI